MATNASQRSMELTVTRLYRMPIPLSHELLLACLFQALSRLVLIISLGEGHRLRMNGEVARVQIG